MKSTNQILSRIRRIAYRPRYEFLRWDYLRKQRQSKPVEYILPNELIIHLHPEGKIAEWLYTARFEQKQLAQVINLLKQGMNVIDIGANIGIYSIVADKFVRPNGKVWAFEPSTETFNRLKKNLLLNNASNVLPVQIALGNIVESEILLRRDSGLPDSHRYIIDNQSMEKSKLNSYINNQQFNDPGDNELVTVTTLDHYLDQYIKDQSIDFIKIDVEGAELLVLLGSEKVIRSNPNIMIMFECAQIFCDRYNYKQKDVFFLLKEYDLNCYCYHPYTNKWESSLELLTSSNIIWACRDITQMSRLSKIQNG